MTREQAITELNTFKIGAKSELGENALDMAIKALEKEPRKTGHWIDHSDEGCVECSECGSCTNCDGNIADLHFCFSCGAKMQEVENNDSKRSN